MSTSDRASSPLLNPVLVLRKQPVPEPASGGAPGAKDIVRGRLDRQRQALAEGVDQIIADAALYATHGGRIHLVACMFGDSFAPSWTPKILFSADLGCRLVAPARQGYLAEAVVAKLPQLARFIRSTGSIKAKVAISRVKEIRAFDATELLRGRNLDAVWDAAAEVDGGKAFVLWRIPFRDESARASVIGTLERLERQQALLPTFPAISLPAPAPGNATPVMRRDQTALARAMRRYRSEGTARSFVTVPTKAALMTIAASGSSFRIDPVRRIEVTALGVGAEPTPPVPNAAALPNWPDDDRAGLNRRYEPLGQVLRISSSHRNPRAIPPETEP